MELRVEQPDLAAPGAMIASALSADSTAERADMLDDTHVVMSGSSMASPFVTGLVALMLEKDATLTPDAALARALIMDPPVLILDDCLSSVDAQTEAEILHELRSILRDKTCLIISHRISAVKEADEILVLDEGQIIERGNHDQLVRQGGVYAELYQQQRLSEELEQI